VPAGLAHETVGLRNGVDHPAGELVRKAGVMSVVVTGGVVRPGDPIVAQLPARPHQPLERV